MRVLLFLLLGYLLWQLGKVVFRKYLSGSSGSKRFRSQEDIRFEDQPSNKGSSGKDSIPYTDQNVKETRYRDID